MTILPLVSNLLLSPLPTLPLVTNKQLPLSPLPPPPLLSLKISTFTNPSIPQLAITSKNKEAGSLISICFPSLAWANIYYSKSGHFNVQVLVGENEPEEVLLRKFKREVMRAGIIKECKRRMFFENKQDKKKRKARDAARKNRRRPYQPKDRWKKEEELKAQKENKKEEEEDDNWELPEGELPY